MDKTPFGVLSASPFHNELCMLYCRSVYGDLLNLLQILATSLSWHLTAREKTEEYHRPPEIYLMQAHVAVTPGI